MLIMTALHARRSNALCSDHVYLRANSVVLMKSTENRLANGGRTNLNRLPMYVMLPHARSLPMKIFTRRLDCHQTY